MTTDPPVLGLVAGDGVYPEYIVRGARRRTPELRIVAVGFKGETNPAVIPLCDAYQEFSVGQISKPFSFLKKHGVRNVIMAGGINPKNILSLRPDLRTLSVLMRMPAKNADSLLGAVITEAEKEGFTILPAFTYMEEHMPQPGHIAGPRPTTEQWEDAVFGMQMAKEISRLHIGQSVVVHGGTVVAVEAIEGTNNCIRRSGELGNGKPATLAKVARLGHDMRFDIPTIGPVTIETCAECGVRQIALEAGKTILLERDRVAELCKRHKISLHAMDASGEGCPQPENPAQ